MSCPEYEADHHLDRLFMSAYQVTIHCAEEYPNMILSARFLWAEKEPEPTKALHSESPTSCPRRYVTARRVHFACMHRRLLLPPPRQSGTCVHASDRSCPFEFSRPACPTRRGILGRSGRISVTSIQFRPQRLPGGRKNQLAWSSELKIIQAIGGLPYFLNKPLSASPRRSCPVLSCSRARIRNCRDTAGSK